MYINRIYGSKFFTLLTILIGIFQFSFTAHSEELVFAVDEAPYCPYALCEKGKDGFVIDIVKAIYTSKGYSVKIVSAPWTRALDLANKGETDGVINVLKDSAPKLIYPKIVVSIFNPIVIALKTNPWRYENMDSFKSVRLGLIKDYGYTDGRPDFVRFLESKPNVEWVSGSEPLLQIIKMIVAGRLDATTDDKAVVDYVLHQAGMGHLFKEASQIDPKLIVENYVAFSPQKSNAKKLAAIFDEGMLELRKSGKLKAILAVYGVKDTSREAR